MKAVARLIYLHFFGAAGLRWLSAAGLISIAVCTGLWRWRPDWLPAILFGWFGMAALFVGTALMPVIVARVASSYCSTIVPHLRFKLLASAFGTVLLVALPVSILMYAGVGQTNAAYARHMDPTVLAAVRAANIKLTCVVFLAAANFFTWMYVIAWLVTSRRNAWGLFRALLVLCVVLYAPVRQLAALDASLRNNLMQLGVTWAVLATVFLGWPHWKSLGRNLLNRLRRAGGSLARPFPLNVSWRATDLVLGTAHPWLMAAAVGLPTLFVVRISAYVPSVWLCCLVLSATCSAAIAGQASSRSRALWLAGSWTRVELFRQVERSFWRHNVIVLSVLLVLMVAVGAYAGCAPRLIALGIPLLATGTALGTYLGLMLTRGIRWQETTLTVGVILGLMAAALMASRADFSSVADLAPFTGLAAALVISAMTFRLLSRRRWERLDWTECRAERMIRPRAV